MLAFRGWRGSNICMGRVDCVVLESFGMGQ